MIVTTWLEQSQIGSIFLVSHTPKVLKTTYHHSQQCMDHGGGPRRIYFLQPFPPLTGLL
jgi:hypothetical protein